MPEPGPLSQTAEMPSAPHAHESEGSGGLMDVSAPMMILTWITFIIMTAVLYKLAWKPILKALSQREDSIRKALEDADKARAESAGAEDRCRKMMEDADSQAQQIMAEARAAARQTASQIETAASQEAAAVVEDAQRQLHAAVEQARKELRMEMADLAGAMAQKLIGEEMDPSLNSRLVQDRAKEL